MQVLSGNILRGTGERLDNSQEESKNSILLSNLSWKIKVPLAVLGFVALVLSLLFHFWQKSPFWLDEALTVNISSVPVKEIVGKLKEDGAPPLYYFLLHFWMGAFGTSDLATRSLSGIFGLAAVVPTYFWGKILRGKMTGIFAALLVLTSPFGFMYSTSVRMYSLVMLETAIGGLLLTLSLRRFTYFRGIGLALVTAALLYAHYWSFYLVAVVLGFLFISVITKKNASNSFKSGLFIILGCLFFMPWLPIFLFQLKHTGTPWAIPPSMTAILNIFTQFTGGNTIYGRLLALILFVLVLLTIFALPLDKFRLIFDIRTVPGVRTLGLIILFTAYLAIMGAMVSKSAYSPRYASILLVEFLLFAASGITLFESRAVIVGIISLSVLLGLWGGISNTDSIRTQAGQVASYLNSKAPEGSLIVYCPDQLGPSLNRLLKPGFFQVSYPAWRSPSPKFVDWIDYAKRNESASPFKFVKRLIKVDRGRYPIYLAFEGGYQTYGTSCQTISGLLSEYFSQDSKVLIGANPFVYYEPYILEAFYPPK